MFIEFKILIGGTFPHQKTVKSFTDNMKLGVIWQQEKFQVLSSKWA
jgi:hypothetical protein